MFFKSILLIFLIGSVWIESDWKIFGSKSVNYGENFEVVIANSFKEREQVNLKLQLDGKFSGVIERKMIKLNSSDEKVSFKIKNHKLKENFTLSATIADSNISQAFDIEMIHKKYSVVIQTDKPSYKPGERMRFRVFIADSGLRPYHSEQLVFEVKDEYGEVVYKFDEIEVQKFKGIYDEEVFIDDSLRVGTWSIQINEFDEDDENIEVLGYTTFKISDQVPRRFDVTIKTRNATLLSEGFVELDVFAKFFLGGKFYVKGKFTIQATVNANGKEWKIAGKTFEISDRKIVTFNIFEDLKLSNLKETALVRFDCEFEEAATGLMVKRSHQTKICPTLCNDIEILKTEKKFKPGFAYSFQVKVYTMETKTLIQTSPEPVKVKLVNHVSDLKCLSLKDVHVEHEGALINGVANFSVNVPKDAFAISITAMFMNSSSAIVVKTDKKASEYLKIQAITKKPTIGEEIELKILSTADLDVLHCVIFQASNVVYKSVVDVLYYNEVEFAFDSTIAMFPSINVVMYFATESGEIISDELLIEFNDESDDFLSELRLDVFPDTLSPGSNCLLSVSSTPTAIVSLTVINAEDFHSQKFKKKDPQKSDSFTMSDRSVSCIEGDLNEETILNSDHKFESLPRDYSETWLFNFHKPDNNKGHFLLNVTVPDTITTWSIGAVSFDPGFGFKFSNIQTLSVERKFFLKVDLPTFVRLGEIIAINVIVFNKLPSTLVIVTIQKSETSEDFEFIEKVSDCKFVSYDDFETFKRLTVLENSTGSATFLIRPLKIGNISLAITAKETTTSTSFHVKKVLKVQLKSLAKYLKKSYTIDLRQTNEIAHDFSFRVPKNALKRSIKVEGIAVGDVLGQTFVDISDVITTDPIVSTEKTVLLQFMKSIYLVKYLTASKQMTYLNQTMIDNQLTAAVNQIMARKNIDGSFSFKGQGRFESIWLTAYVVKCLSQVRNLTTVDELSIQSALNFLKSQQVSANSMNMENKSLSGSFIELGSEKKTNISLTVFVAISFLESSKNVAEHEDSVSRVLDFIDKNVLEMENNLDIAMSAYAFSLAKHKSSKDLLTHLQANAIIEQGKQHWRFDETGVEDKKLELEIAAYVVLTYIQRDEEFKVFPIMMWIVEQVNQNDGNFMSTVTQALTELSRIFLSSATSMSLIVTSVGKQVNVDIEKSKALYFHLPDESRNIQIYAKGTGFSVLEVTLKYNDLVLKFKERFSILIEVKPQADDNSLSLIVCAMKKNYDDDDEGDIKNQILVDVAMQVELPNGFIFNYDSESKKMFNVLKVKRFEIHIHQSLVTLYFDFKANAKICPEIKARRVEIKQPTMSTVKIQYREETVAVEYYSVKGSQYCGK